jgi:hypothetical protein
MAEASIWFDELHAARTAAKLGDMAPEEVAAAKKAWEGAARVIVFDCGATAMQPLTSLDECWDDLPAVSADYGHARDAIRAHVERLLDPGLQMHPSGT